MAGAGAAGGQVDFEAADSAVQGAVKEGEIDPSGSQFQTGPSLLSAQGERARIEGIELGAGKRELELAQKMEEEGNRMRDPRFQRIEPPPAQEQGEPTSPDVEAQMERDGILPDGSPLTARTVYDPSRQAQTQNAPANVPAEQAPAAPQEQSFDDQFFSLPAENPGAAPNGANGSGMLTLSDGTVIPTSRAEEWRKSAQEYEQKQLDLDRREQSLINERANMDASIDFARRSPVVANQSMGISPEHLAQDLRRSGHLGQENQAGDDFLSEGSSGVPSSSQNDYLASELRRVEGRLNEQEANRRAGDEMTHKVGLINSAKDHLEEIRQKSEILKANPMSGALVENVLYEIGREIQNNTIPLERDRVIRNAENLLKQKVRSASTSTPNKVQAIERAVERKKTARPPGGQITYAPQTGVSPQDRRADQVRFADEETRKEDFYRWLQASGS